MLLYFKATIYAYEKRFRIDQAYFKIKIIATKSKHNLYSTSNVPISYY